MQLRTRDSPGQDKYGSANIAVSEYGRVGLAGTSAANDASLDQHHADVVRLCLVLVDLLRARGDDLLPLFFWLGVAHGW